MMNKKTRRLVYEKYDGRCAYCGQSLALKEMQVDHIKPIARGQTPALRKMMGIEIGEDSLDNYNPSCRACNFRKGMLTIDEFREAIDNGLKVLEKNFTFKMMLKYRKIAVCCSERTKFFFEMHREIQELYPKGVDID